MGLSVYSKRVGTAWAAWSKLGGLAGCSWLQTPLGILHLEQLPC